MFDATEVVQKRSGASKKMSSKNMNLIAKNQTVLTTVNMGNDSATSSVAKKAAILIGN
jgi:hypothetical protein